jgi:hypothetical protein
MNLQTVAQKWSFTDLVGNWRAENGAGLQVIDSNNIYVVYNQEKKKVAHFLINLKSNPSTLDFEVQDSLAQMTLKTLFQFVTKDLIQWQVFEGERPANFTASDGELLYLRRRQ